MRRRGERGLADVISIHNYLTNKILLSGTGKQLVHNFERRGQRQWRYERTERDWSLPTSAVEYGLSKLGYTSLKVKQMRAVESVLKGK